MMNVKIIGTSHIAKQSVNEIKKAIVEGKPDIVAVELDIQRATALLQKGKNKISLEAIFKIGVKGYIFAKIGQIVQQKLGKMVGVTPGSDMKTALEMAKEEGMDVALIDQPIQITLKKFSKGLTWRERWRFFVDLLKGLVSPKKQMKELGLKNFDLRKVPEKEIITKMINQMKRRYPSVYKALVEDRNKYMVRKLVKLLRDNPKKKILCVVGAGHKEGMEKLLLNVEVVR
jgi:pheromone shutdown-related protein TraB